MRATKSVSQVSAINAPTRDFGARNAATRPSFISRAERFSADFISGAERLPNGNTVMSNWVGHGQFGKAPHIIEVTREKKVVWTFADHQTMKTISSIQLLDVPGDVTQGEIAH